MGARAIKVDFLLEPRAQPAGVGDRQCDPVPVGGPVAACRRQHGGRTRIAVHAFGVVVFIVVQKDLPGVSQLRIAVFIIRDNRAELDGRWLVDGIGIEAVDAGGMNNGRRVVQ